MKRECYTLIQNMDNLKKFIDFLPDLLEHEKFYVALYARKKYSTDPNVKMGDKEQLKIFISDKKRLIAKIQQHEIPVGAYKLKNGDSVPQETLALYISTNPRSMKKATVGTGKKAWDLFEKNKYNIHAEVLSCIQVSKSSTVFVTFDIDDVDVLDYIWLDENLGSENYRAIKTRGGYHLLVYPELTTDFRKERKMSLNWHQLIRETFTVVQICDITSPIVGTYQGGHEPKLI